MYCLPPPTGPPTPALKNGSIFSSAPPPASSTMPVRTFTTRVPSFAVSACASQRTTTSASQSRPGGLVSSTGSSRGRRSSPRPRRRRAPAGAAWRRRSRARGARPALAAVEDAASWLLAPALARRPRRRGARSRRARRARPAAAVSFSGSHGSASTPSFSLARPASRESAMTSSPRAFSAATRCDPMRPVAPVTVTRFMRRPSSGPGSRRSCMPGRAYAPVAGGPGGARLASRRENLVRGLAAVE